MDDLAKRQNYNIPKSQSDRVLAADRGVFDPKIILQQKLETQDYNPFGKAGGGAPNKKLQPGEHNLSGVMSSSRNICLIQHKTSILPKRIPINLSLSITLNNIHNRSIQGITCLKALYQ